MNVDTNGEFSTNIKLIRGSKKKYRWEITVRGNDQNDDARCVERCKDIDLKLRALYGETNE